MISLFEKTNLKKKEFSSGLERNDNVNHSFDHSLDCCKILLKRNDRKIHEFSSFSFKSVYVSITTDFFR